MNETTSLVARCDWLALATIAEDAEPSSSYVPFAIVESAFAIAVSRLSVHTRDLRARADASVLLVPDPSAEHDPFARPRLAVDVRAAFAERDSSRSHAIWKALQARLGDTAALLRALPDFETLLLVPKSARLILGFGAASDIDAAALQTALRAVAVKTEHRPHL